MTRRVYPIQTGGTPITSLWTNGTIIYELMMLEAILVTLGTLLCSARLSCLKRVTEDSEIWRGKSFIGISDPPRSSQLELKKCLAEAGAAEIRQLNR
jgi:hypothetical protein